MKIGIVTCCHCHNFGADLQAYALQHVLARMGHDATVIDFNRKAPSREQVRYRRNRAIVNRFRNGGVRAVLELLSVLAQFAKSKATRPSAAAIKHLNEGNDRFERFWTNHVSHTARFEIEDLDKADEYDAYIAGSD